MSDDRQPQEIRQRMNALRGSLGVGVEQVASGVRQKTDWRYYVRSHPWMTVAAATAAGYFLVPSRPTVKKYVPSAKELERLVKRDKVELSPKKHDPAEASLTNKLFAMAAAAASQAALGYASGQLDGFLSKAKQKQPAEPRPTSVHPK